MHFVNKYYEEMIIFYYFAMMFLHMINSSRPRYKKIRRLAGLPSLQLMEYTHNSFFS